MATNRSGNINEGCANVRELGKARPMTLDSVLAIFSTTQAPTGTAILQRVEEGRIRLDDAARRYVPEIAEIQVLDGFDSAGQPRLGARAPKRDITVGDLMLHTTGFSHEFFQPSSATRRPRPPAGRWAGPGWAICMTGSTAKTALVASGARRSCRS